MIDSIRVSVDVHKNVDEASAMLALEPDVYARGGRLVRVVRDASAPPGVVRAPGATAIRELLRPTAVEILSRVRWMKLSKAKGDWVPTLPPMHVVSAVLERGAWSGVRPLVGVLETPALRPDGTIIDEPGYDEATGYLYLPSEDFPRILAKPTREQAFAARDALLEVVTDFPFASPAHRSAWLAFVLTLFARPAIGGCTPLVAVDATTRGTGKGRLVDATSVLALGREATKTPLPQDDEEARKRITSLILEGEALACIDNVSAVISLPSLDAALTATTWKDRKLGANETVTAPNRLVWVATGNNLALGGDTARRTLHIRLESPLENPEDREDFRHADLLAWVRANRPRLVVAALTILRAYFAAGAPSGGVKRWGSFEQWSHVVASAVVFAGMPDPQSTRQELEATSDTTKSALVALFDGWAKLGGQDGLTAKAAIGLLYGRHEGPPDGFDNLREAIESLAPARDGKPPSAMKLGYALRHFRRRVVAGRWLDSVQDRSNVQRWAVRSAGDAGEAGDVSNPSREKFGNFQSKEGEKCPASPASPAGEGDLFADWVNGKVLQ